MWRRYFARDGICINFWNTQKSNSHSLLSVFCSKADRVLNFWNAPFYQARNLWNASFSKRYKHSNQYCPENGAFQKFRAWKSEAFHKLSTWSAFEQKQSEPRLRKNSLMPLAALIFGCIEKNGKQNWVENLLNDFE